MNGEAKATELDRSVALPGSTCTNTWATTPIESATCRLSLTTAERLFPGFESLRKGKSRLPCRASQQGDQQQRGQKITNAGAGDHGIE